MSNFHYIYFVGYFNKKNNEKDKYIGKNDSDIQNIKLYDNSQKLILTIVKNQIFKRNLTTPILKAKSEFELNRTHYSHEVQEAFNLFIKDVENFFCCGEKTKEESLAFSEKNGQNIENLRLAIVKNTNFIDSEFENGIYKN